MVGRSDLRVCWSRGRSYIKTQIEVRKDLSVSISTRFRDLSTKISRAGFQGPAAIAEIYPGTTLKTLTSPLDDYGQLGTKDGDDIASW